MLCFFDLKWTTATKMKDKRPSNSRTASITRVLLDSHGFIFSWIHLPLMLFQRACFKSRHLTLPLETFFYCIIKPWIETWENLKEENHMWWSSSSSDSERHGDLCLGSDNSCFVFSVKKVALFHAGNSDLAFVRWNTFLLSHLTTTQADNVTLASRVHLSTWIQLLKIPS